MLRPKKKISKKEIKQDTLVTWYAELSSYYEAHKKPIGMIVTAVVVVVIAVLVILKNRSDANARAMIQLGQVGQLVEAGQLQSAIDGVPERNIPGLKSIVDNTGSTRGGELARFLLAGTYLQLGKYDEAQEQFEDFNPPDDRLAASRYAGVAQCQEAKKDYSEAGENFERAAGVLPEDPAAGEYLFHAARNFTLAGNNANALEMYKRLKKNFPQSLYARDVDRYIQSLSL